MTSDDLVLSFDQSTDDNFIIFDSVANDIEIQGSEATPRQIMTSDYEKLTHKPSVNFVELIGNKDSAELGLEPAQEVISMLDIMSIFRRTIGE